MVHNDRMHSGYQCWRYDIFVELDSDIREFRRLACAGCGDDIDQLTEPTMKWLVFDSGTNVRTRYLESYVQCSTK